ncbi:hypothetical protein MVEN_02371900 [Mycena venus]|uniref:Uncharacterized protein n=1 Tax=Mycena venus TaxID=2733690 RepID=A0A8H7CF07_9AGAR|nr:hypothetical protein MVEN_02371900 [Mycena venus]
MTWNLPTIDCTLQNHRPQVTRTTHATDALLVISSLAAAIENSAPHLNRDLKHFGLLSETPTRKIPSKKLALFTNKKPHPPCPRFSVRLVLVVIGLLHVPRVRRAPVPLRAVSSARESKTSVLSGDASSASAAASASPITALSPCALGCHRGY